MAKVLIIDDDQYMCGLVRDWLLGEHHEVEMAHDGIWASELLAVSSFDVIVLDWDLPGKNGIEILKEFRERGGQTPVIMLTGKSTISDKEQGFYSGADDYLAKPVTIKELVLRIGALLRRPPQLVAETLQLDDIKLNPNTHELTKNGIPVHLQPRDFSLFKFLMTHPHTVFSADALLARVWESDSEASPEALRTAIKRIRKKLDEGKDETSSVIQTIPRVGYKIRNSKPDPHG